MRFIISPDLCHHIPHNDTALTSLDWRTVSKLTDVPEKCWGAEWLANGTRHREERNMVVREILSRPKVVAELSFGDLERLVIKFEGLLLRAASYKEVTVRICLYGEDEEQC
jgi:hypothetical protein